MSKSLWFVELVKHGNLVEASIVRARDPRAAGVLAVEASNDPGARVEKCESLAAAEGETAVVYRAVYPLR
jgi:hypothetical protein